MNALFSFLAGLVMALGSSFQPVGPTVGTSGVTNLPYDTGKNGVLRIQQNAAGFQWVATGTAITANRTFTIPDASGTFCLTTTCQSFASSTNPLMATYFVSTSTSATSTFAFGLQTTRLNVSSGTSTFANGLQVNGGCVQVNGACIGAGASSPMVYLTTLTATSATPYLWYTGISSTYKTYQFNFNNITPASNAVSFFSRFSTNNGTSYIATGYTNVSADTNGIYLQDNTAAIGAVPLSNSAGTPGYSGIAYLHNPSTTQSNKMLSGNNGILNGSSAVSEGAFLGYYGASIVAVNAIQFLFTSGNIATGTIDVYGIKNN